MRKNFIKELFETCQKVRECWHRKQFKWGGKEFLFRGLIKCAITGKVVTAFTKKKTYANGDSGEWTYLRSYDPKNPTKFLYVKEEKIMEEVQKIFDSMKLEPEMLAEVTEYIKTSSNSEKEFHNQHIKNLNSEHTKIKNHLDRLVEMYLEGLIDKGAMEVKRQELTARREEIVKDIANHNEVDDSFAKRLITILELASKAGETFKGSTINEKRELINLTLLNLELKGCKLVLQ